MRHLKKFGFAFLLAPRPFERVRWRSAAASVFRVSLTALRLFCLRLPRATLPKTVNGLWARHATRFLLAAYHSPQVVSGYAGSVGCSRKEQYPQT